MRDNQKSLVTVCYKRFFAFDTHESLTESAEEVEYQQKSGIICRRTVISAVE